MDKLREKMCKMLKCEPEDLKILDAVRYTWTEVQPILERIGCERPTLDQVINTVLRMGVGDICKAIGRRNNELVRKKNRTEEEQKAFQALVGASFMDFTINVNGRDSRILCTAHKETYQKYLRKTIKEVEHKTGFPIEFI